MKPPKRESDGKWGYKGARPKSTNSMQVLSTKDKTTKQRMNGSEKY